MTAAAWDPGPRAAGPAAPAAQRGARVSAAVAGALAVIGAGAAVVLPAADRSILAALAAAAVVLAVRRSPRTATLAVLAALPFLGLARRLLIPVAGWSSFDPLLLVGPAAALALAHRLAVEERRPPVVDGMSAAVALLAGWSVAETLNPVAWQPAAGAVGLLFTAVPLLWYLVGRHLADGALVARLIPLTTLAGCAAAAYGLWQGAAGLPSWDARWLALGGYPSLDLGNGSVRTFSTFASSAEYAAFLAVAAVCALAAALRGRPRVAVALPLLVGALFLDSTRSEMVLLGAAAVVLVILRSGRLRAAAIVLLAVVAATAVADRAVGPALIAGAQRSGSQSVSHQVAGLVDPFNQDRSTLQLHIQNAADGLGTAMRHPLGLGTAAENLAGVRVGEGAGTTDMDVTDEFVALGLAGGLLFSGIVAVSLVRAGRLAARSRDAADLAAVGILVVTLGQWLGGAYAVAPLVWLLAGWTGARWAARSQAAGSAVAATLEGGMER